MNGAKCFQCGFVSSRSNEKCRRCGAAFREAGVNSQVIPGQSKTKFLVIGVVTAVITLLVGVRFVLAVLTSQPPSPTEVSRLLYSEDELKEPLTLVFQTGFTRTANTGDQPEDYVLQDYFEAQVLKRLGLIDVAFTKTKAPNRECYRYRYVAAPQTALDQNFVRPAIVERDPNGPYEQCDDVWTYATKIDFVDSNIVEASTISDRAPLLTDIPYPAPPHQRPSAWRGPPVTSTRVPIGSIEIVEVSDPVARQSGGTYTVGFKFRIKPNALGTLVDLNSPVHKSLPDGIRQLFEYKIFDRNEVEKRLQYLVNARGTDGLTFGHADLVKEGIFNPRWKIGRIYLDPMDKTPYAFHKIEQ